jgi:Xaa-Pro aminopeptidase
MASAWALSRRLMGPKTRQTRFLHRAAYNGSERKLPFAHSEYADRRNAVLSEMRGNCIALFPSAIPAHMSEDVPYLYHQNTDLLYLCGCMEPGSVLMLDSTDTKSGTSAGQGQSVLFLRPRDLERESWDGPMLGVSDKTRSLFGVDAVFPDSELPNIVAQRMTVSNCHEMYLDPAINSSLSSSLLGTLSNSTDVQLLSKWSRSIVPKSLVNSSRLIKSPAEQDQLRKAASIISMAMNDAMAFSMLCDDTHNTQSEALSLPERHIEAMVEYSSKVRGATRMAFPSVVASGNNGTTLHYMANKARALIGDLVMVDAGCQFQNYCSDVSRTWPVGGRFSRAQRALYELVLDVQLRCIDLSRVGQYRGEPISLNTIHMVAAEELSRGLVKLGFLKGKTVEQVLEDGMYSRWFNHAIGHYLGMDVHDTHTVSKSIPLQAGMCITIEPGLYVRADDEMAPPEFRGIGIRIEVRENRPLFPANDRIRFQILVALSSTADCLTDDPYFPFCKDDLLVAPSGLPPSVLSDEAVKTVADIEQLVGSADLSRLPAPMWRLVQG